ncbi:MAG: hypothetical protein JNL01_15180 [Bdellovibrionales bacterium]|nr:hypothetical protein [Bdellovibrionales bacterium]
MKLKLSEQTGVQVLVVSEDVPVQQAAVLRAGFIKIAASGPGKKKFVIDLTQTTTIEPAAWNELLSIAKTAEDQGAVCVFVSKQADMTPTNDPKAAVEAFKGDLARLWHNQSLLTFQLHAYRKLASEAKAKLAKVDLKTVHKIRTEHSEVTALITELESQIQTAFESTRVQEAPFADTSDGKNIASIADQALSFKSAWVTTRPSPT